MIELANEALIHTELRIWGSSFTRSKQSLFSTIGQKSLVKSYYSNKVSAAVKAQIQNASTSNLQAIGEGEENEDSDYDAEGPMEHYRPTHE